MPTTMKTPGVYIQELDAFGNSVVPVPTAVPAFVGYTEKTTYNGKSLVMTPVKIESLAHFTSIFEDADPTNRPKAKFGINLVPKPLTLADGKTKLYVNPPTEEIDELGQGGDYYFTTADSQLTGPKSTGWSVDQDTVKSGTGEPEATTGENNNPFAAGTVYLDTSGKKAYTKKGTKWNVSGNLTVDSGAPDGDVGSTGDYYMDKNDNNKIYGPKAEQEWPAAAAITSAEGAPTGTTAEKGSLYLDSKANKIYGPKSTDVGAEWNADIAPTELPKGYAAPDIVVKQPDSGIPMLHNAMRFFYANEGADCYVVSVGPTTDSKAFTDTGPFEKAIDALEKEMEPTMLVIPDAIRFPNSDAYSLQEKMMNHCADMMNRVAILDISDGFMETTIEKDPVGEFRQGANAALAKNYSYAAAYYPWLHTTILQESDISFQNISPDSISGLADWLESEFKSKKQFLDDSGNLNSTTQEVLNDFEAAATPEKITDEIAPKIAAADSAFKIISSLYPLVLSKIRRTLNLFPPSAAMAGVITAVDNSLGVWKAPANVGIQSVITPAVKVDDKAQEDLNKPITGKAICAIRAFKGEGNLVWGARTLDGNSNDWRYINVRRTLIYLEQSIKEAAKAYVFEPNDSNTWSSIKSMISNFLTGVWKQGGLAGPKPADAYSVSVGLGATMTNDDIQNGIMRIKVLVAVSHPAEFIEITFQQQQQKA